LLLKIIQRGYRVIHEKEAVAYEEIVVTCKDEFKTKIRTILLDLHGLFSQKNLLNPFKFPLVAWGLISHKLLRWLLPNFLICIFVLNILLIQFSLYRFFFTLQIMFYFFAFIGYLLDKIEIKFAPFGIPLSFCLRNLIALVGLYDFIAGKRVSKWQPIR